VKNMAHDAVPSDAPPRISDRDKCLILNDLASILKGS